MGNKQGHELSPEEKQKLRDVKEREKRLLKEEKESKKQQKKDDKKLKKENKKKGIHGGASSIGDDDAQSIGGSSVWSEKSVGADSQPESWYHSASEPGSKRSSIYMPASAGPGYYQHDCWARGYEESGSEKSSKTPSRSSSKVRVDTSNLRSSSLERYPLGVPTGQHVVGGSMDLSSAAAKKYLKDNDPKVVNSDAEVVSSMIASRYEETIRSSREKLDRSSVDRKDLVERATLLGKYRESQEKVDKTSISSITSKSTVGSSAYATADEGSLRSLKSSIISTYHSAEEGSIRSVKRKTSNEGTLNMTSIYDSAEEGPIMSHGAKRMTVSNKDTGSLTGSLKSSVYYSADEGSIASSEVRRVIASNKDTASQRSSVYYSADEGSIASGTEGKRAGGDTSSVGGGSLYYSADEGGSIAGSLYYTATSGSEVEDHADDDLLGKDRPTAPGRPEGVDREGSALSTRAYVRVENDALLLRWDPPQTDGGSPITGYIMEKCEGESSQWVRVNLIPIKNTEYAVANLIGGRDYRFRVSAENAVGCSDASSASESVSISVDQEGTEPHFLRELRNVTAIQGQRVEFTVDIVGTPMPDVTWYKDGFELYDTKRYDFNVEGDRYTLALKTAKITDSGDIRVRATNRAGVANSQAVLNVNAPPQINLPPNYEQGIIFDTDELIRLRVPYTGRPQPIANWLHNHKEIAASERHSQDVSEKFCTLKIAGASRVDKGMYTLNLENEIGKASSAFFVTVTDRPDPPSMPAITDVSGTSVSLRWENPADDGGCRISNYTIEYFRVGWDVWLKAASSHIPWTQLSDLIVGSEYKFRVKAENAYGVSEPGPESEQILIEEGTSPPGSFDYETYKSTTAVGSSLPDEVSRLKGDSTSFESGEGGSGSDAEGYAERLRLREMGFSDELGSSGKEPSLDLGTSSSENLHRADVMDVDEGLRGDVGPTPPPRSPRPHSKDTLSSDSLQHPISTPSPRPPGDESGDSTVTARMEAVTVAAGGEAVLVVALEGIDAKTIHWQKGGQPLEGGSHYTTTSTKESAPLLIHGASPEDTGTYTAVVTRQDGTQARAAVALRVAAPGAKGRVEAPVFVRTLSDLATKVGTRVRFLVELRAASDVQVYWYQANKEILGGPRHRLLREGNFFCVDISPLTVADEGTWRCVAENASGQATSSAMLRVMVPKGYRTPVFLEELEALLTAAGTVSLECKVVGVPTPLLKWYKDGKEIKAGDVFALTANPDDPTSLGTYTCEAINCMGVATSSSKVRVMSREGSLRPPSRTERSPTPVGPVPKLLEELTDKRVKIGEKLKLNINVIVPPEILQIIWYNNGRKIEESEKYRLSDEGGGNYGIEVSPVELGDDGEWKVVIKNQGGYSSSSCKLTLTVPRNYRSPRFLEDLKALLTEEGLVSFECKVVGYPTPILQWFKDGQELKPGDVYQLSGTNSLGKYSCIAKNLMGETMSSAELTLDDIKSHLNEEEKEQLLATNVPPRFMQGLKSRDTKIGDPIRLTVQVTVTPAPTIAWYHEDEVISESSKFLMGMEDPGIFHLDISKLDMADQGEWKCMASNDYGHSVTTANIKLVIPRHYKKPVFLEPLRAVLSQEGTVNLECKVIGVPQPTLKWFKDGVELKPGDIHRIISGEDGTCCLGTYTCEAFNCMGSDSSSAELLGFEDKVNAAGGKNVPESPMDIMRNPSLSTIHEERSSQISIYESVAENMSFEEEHADISVSIDGREVSISLYETPDISEAEAKQIAEIYADEISDHLSAHESNHAELPPLRFSRQTSKKGPLLMEAMVIDVENEAFDEYMSMADVGFEDLRTEADVDELSAMEAIVVDEREPLRSDIADLPEMEVWGEEHVSAQTVSTKSRGVANINEANILEPDLRSLSEQGMSMLHTHAKEKDASKDEALVINEAQVLNGEVISMSTDSIHKTVAQQGHIDSMNVAQMEEQIIMSAEEMLSSEKAGKQAQARRSVIAHEAVGITTFQEVEEATNIKSEEKSLKKVKKATAKTSRKEQEALVMEQVDVVDGQLVQSMKVSKAQAQHALEGQVSAAGVAMQQEQDFYTAAQDIPESFVAEETEADFSEIHSTLEPMQYSEHYGYEHAQEFEGYSLEEQRAMEIEASYRQALGIDEREGYIMAEDFTVSGGQETQAHVQQTLHEAVGGYEALMVQEADVDVANLNVFNREDMSHMLTQAQEKTGSLAECIVIEEADLQSEAAIISQRPAVKPETAEFEIVEGVAESAIIGEKPVVEEMDVDMEEIQNTEAKKRSSVKTGSTDSLNLESKSKKSKTGSTDSLNLSGSENLTPDQIKTKKAELIKKMEEMRAKKDAIQNEIDSPSTMSTIETTESKETNEIQKSNKLDMQKTAQDAVEMIDAMSAILTEQEKLNGEATKPNISNKGENNERVTELNELEAKKKELLAKKQEILAKQEAVRRLREQSEEPTSDFTTSEMSFTDYDSTLVDSVIETLGRDESFVSNLDADVKSQLQDLELTMKEIEKSLQLGTEIQHGQLEDLSLEETTEELTIKREKEIDILDGVNKTKKSISKEKKEKRAKRSISKELDERSQRSISKEKERSERSISKEKEKRRSISKEKEQTDRGSSKEKSVRSSLILSGEDAQDAQTAMEVEMDAELAVEEMEDAQAKRGKRSASRETGEELGEEFQKRRNRSVSKEKEERSKRSISKEKENRPSIASSIYKAEDISMDIETEEEMIALEKELEAERLEFEAEKRSSGTDLDRLERSKRSASKEKTSKKSKKGGLTGDEAKIAMGIDPEELTGKEYTSLEKSSKRTTRSSSRENDENKSSIKREKKSSLKGNEATDSQIESSVTDDTENSSISRRGSKEKRSSIKRNSSDDKIARKSSLKRSNSGLNILTPEVVRTLSPETVQDLTPENIKAMSLEAISVFPPNAIKALSPEAVAALSPEAVQAMSPEAIKAMTPECVKAISPKAIKVMSPEAIKVLSPEGIKLLTTEAVKALTPEAMKVMSLEQVKAITREAIKVMSPETANAMTPDKVKAMHDAIRDMSPEKARSMSPESASKMGPNEVRAMSPAIVKTMTVEAIQAIPSESISAMSPEAVAVLSPEVVKNLSPDSVKSMTPEAIQALSPEAIRAMTPEAVRALSPEVVKVMTPEAIEALSPEAVKAMSPEAVRAMSPEAVRVMSPGAVRAMSPEAIRAMSPDAVNAMSRGALKAMSPEAVSVISSETVGALSPEAVRAMSPDAVKAMSPEAINAMSPEAIKALTPEVIRAMSPETIMAITPEAIKVMSVESIKAISTDALKAMSPEAAQTISNEVMSQMSHEAIEIISPKAQTAQILTDIKSLSQPETVKEMTPRDVRAKTPESFKALSPEAVKVMTPAMVEALTPEAIQSMTPAAVHAMTPEAANAISPEAISCMSPDAVKALTPDAIKAMSPQAIQAMTPEAVGAMSPDSVKAMSADAVKAMSPEAISAITPNALKAMSPETIKVIPPEAIQVLSVDAVKSLTVEALKQMPVESVQAFSAEAVSILSQEAVKVITPKVACSALHGDANSITPDIAQTMSPAEIKVMSPETAKQMQPEAVSAIPPKAMEAMRPETVKALPPATVHELSPDAVQALSPEAVKVLSPEAVKAITPEAIGVMSPVAVKALSPKSVQAMTPEAVEAISPDSIHAMSPDAIKALSPDAIKSMSPDAVKAISPEAVKAMSPEAIKAISPEAIKIMSAEAVKLFSADALESMSMEAVQAISSEALSAMSTESVKIISPKVIEKSVSGEVKEITPETAKTITPVEMRTMSPESIRAMSPEVIKSITPDTMRAMSPEAIKSLSPESVKELTPAVMKALTPEVVKVMTPEAIQSISPEAINAMTPEAVKAMSPEVVKSLSPEAVQSLSPTAVRAMSPEAIRALSPEVINTMSPESITAFSPEAVQAMSPEAINAITPNSLQAMSPEAVRAISPEAAMALSVESLQSFSTDALQAMSVETAKAIPSEVVSSLSTDSAKAILIKTRSDNIMTPENAKSITPMEIKTMSPSAVQELKPETLKFISPEAIKAMTPECVKALSPEAVKAMSPQMIKALSPEAIKAMTPEAIKVLSPEAVTGMSPEAIKSISAESIKALSPEAIKSLSPQAVKAISPEAINAMTPEAVRSLSPDSVKALSPQTVKALSPEIVQAISPEAVKAMSSQAIKAMTPEAVNLLSPEAVKEISPVILNQMSPEAVKAISPEAVKAMSPQVIKQMKPDAVNALSPEAVKEISPAILNQMSPEAVKAISPEAVKAMSPQAIKQMKPEAVNALSPEAVKEISPVILNQMSPEAVKAISPEAVKVMSVEAIQSLSSEALQSMSVEATKAIPTEVISEMSNEATKVISSKVTSKISVNEEMSITPEKIESMTVNEIKSLRPGDISQMSPEAINAIPPEAVKAMSPQSIKAMSPEAVNSLSPEAVKEISPVVLNQMSPEAVKAISPEAVKAMSPQAIKQMKPDVINALSPEAVKEISPAILNQMSPEAVKAISPEAVKAMSPQAIKQMKPDAVNALSPEAVKEISPVILNQMSPEAVKAISPEAVKAMSVEAIQSLSSEALQSMSVEATKAIPTEVISEMSNEATKVISSKVTSKTTVNEEKTITPEKIKSMSPNEIKSLRPGVISQMSPEAIKAIPPEAVKIMSKDAIKALSPESVQAMSPEAIKAISPEAVRAMSPEVVKAISPEAIKVMSPEAISSISSEAVKVLSAEAIRAKSPEAVKVLSAQAVKAKSPEASEAMENVSSELSKSSSESSFSVDSNMSVEQLDMAKRRKRSTSKDINEKRPSLKEKNNKEEQRREEEDMLRLQRKERESREREMKKAEEHERKKREEQDLAEKRKRQREDEDRMLREQAEKLQKEAETNAEKRKSLKEDQMRLLKEEEEREAEEEKEKRERHAKRKEEQEKQKMEEDERIQKEDEERKKKRKQRQLEEEKALKDQQEKFLKEKEKMSEERRRRKEEEDVKMRAIELDREEEARKEKEDRRMQREKEREQDDLLYEEEEKRRKERRQKRLEDERKANEEDEREENQRKKKIEDEKKRLAEELRKREEEKRKKEDELKQHGEEFLKKEEERRKKKTEERLKIEKEEREEELRRQRETDERKKEERRKKRLQSVEREMEDADMRVRRSRSNTPAPEVRRRDPRKRPKFSTKLSDRQTTRGQRVRMTCNIITPYDEEPPEVEWFKSGLPVEDDERIKCTFQNGVAAIEILHVGRSDCGEYTCSARNRHGRVSTTMDLRIKGDDDQKPSAPSFTTSLRERYVCDEDKLVLSCHVAGHPEPKITWLKDADKLPSSPRFQTSVSEEGICKLIITSPRAGDSGTYTCHAENRVYRDEISVNVRVQDLLEKDRKRDTTTDDSEAPRFVSELCDQYVEENGTLTLQVQVAGSPTPEVLWLLNGRTLHPSGRYRISAIGTTHTFTLFQVTQKDLGMYSCKITNRYGHNYSMCTVEFGTPKPKRGSAAIREEAPTFVERPDSMVTVYKEEEIRMSCTVKGEPTPRVTWMKGMHDISNTYRATKTVKDNTHTIVIRRAEFMDSGTYTVELKNTQGTARAFCSIKVRDGQRSRSRSSSPSLLLEKFPSGFRAPSEEKGGRYIRDVPDKVGTPMASDIGKTWVSLSWGKPEYTGGVPVAAYKIESWIMGEEARWQELGVSPICSFDAYNLKSDREYLFRVTPRNKYGWGEPVMTPRAIRTGRKIEHPNMPRSLPHQIRAMPGGSICLDAQVTGEPMPEVKWYKDGSAIDFNRYPRFSSASSEGSMHEIFGYTNKVSLRIDDLRWDDEGKYELEVLNPGGRVSSYTRLLTTSDCSILQAQETINNNLMALSAQTEDVSNMAPQFTMRLRDRRVQVGFPVRLTCQIVAIPKPSIRWFKDGVLLDVDDCHVVWVEDGHFYTLEVSSSIHDDAGVYYVEASNPFGSITCHARLVVDSGLRSYISPMFIRELEDQNVREGSTITLQTIIEAYPTVGVVWHRDGQRIRPSRKHSFSLDADGIATLHIRDCDFTDGGLYTCTSSNEMGRIESMCRVSVATDMDMSRKKMETSWNMEPMFVRKPRNIDAEEGDRVVIECEVAGHPKPSVTWLKDWLQPSLHSDGARFQEVGQGPVYRLEIPNCKIEDTGAYSILAKNDHGETRAVTSLQVYGKGLKGNLDPGTIRRGVMEHMPLVTRRLQDVRCCDGDSVTLEATVDAPKNSLVRWEKQGKVLKLSNDVESEWDGNKVRLRIKEVYPEDEGEYSCIIFNDKGKAVTSATVIVEMADDKENDVTVQMEHRPDMSRRTTPSCSRSITPSRWSRSSSVAFQREGSAHSWAGAGTSWRESSVSISHWRPLSRGASPMLLAHRMTPEPSPKSRSRRSHGPKFYYIPHDRIVEEGESVTFQCAVKGNPTPKAIWDKDSMTIHTGGRVKVESKDDIRLIEIPKVTQQDAGLYRITIENEMGREQATARLDVIKSSGNKYSGYVRSYHSSPLTTPYFSRTLPSSSVLTGSRLTLSTDFRGSPAPRAKWYKNGELLPMCEDFQQTQNGKTASLEISEVESTHAGTYTCALVSDAGKAECSCEVTVETRKDTGDLPPLFLRGLEDVTSLDGDQVTLSVKLSGTLPLKVIWVRNDQEIKQSADFKYVEGENGQFSLAIRDIFPEDAGVYIAEAYNAHGEAHSYCRLQVHDPRLTAPSPPRIVGSLTGLEVEEGTAARFNVTVLGSPRPSLAWYCDGRKLANTPRIKVTVDEESGTSEETLHSLGILHALSTDSGVVSVVATNSLGSDTANTTLKVNKYSPGSEKSASSNSRLSSSPLAGSKSLSTGKASPATSTSPVPRIHPKLKDLKEMGGINSVDSGIGSVTRESISGMSSSLSNVSELEYDKDITSQSEKMIVPITETIRKQEQLLGISKQPQQLTHSVKDTKDIKEENEVEEDEVEDEGAEILLGPVDMTAICGQSAKFTASFIGNPEPTVSWLKKDHEIEENSRFTIQTEKGASTLSIKNVIPDDCDKYTIVVRNKHAAHASFASLTVASVPDPPVGKPNLSEVTAESVTLSWYGPTYDGGSCVTGYTVESRKIGQVPWNVLIKGVHSTSYIARALDSGSQYEFRIRAQNIHGNSEPSKSSQPVTIETKSASENTENKEEEDEEYMYPPFEVKEVDLEPGSIYDNGYETFEEVGKGRFGVVYRCLNKETGQKRAAKIIKCIQADAKEKVREEISIMNSLRHPKLLQLAAAYERRREIVMVMEYINGGELFERVIAEDFALTERDCILFVRQICEGVQYMHDNMILHLDLKPENILCVHKKSHQIKLIDFGLARRFNPADPCRVLFGTPEFIAPEIINYDPISFSSDMWSIGVVCYVLLSGLSPFMGDNDAETFSNITQAEFDFDDDAFDAISEDAKNFITSLLDKRKEKRLLASDCLKHKWLAQNEGSMNKVVISTDKLKKFIIRRKWQDAAFSKVERHNCPILL